MVVQTKFFSTLRNNCRAFFVSSMVRISNVAPFFGRKVMQFNFFLSIFSYYFVSRENTHEHRGETKYVLNPCGQFEKTLRPTMLTLP